MQLEAAVIRAVAQMSEKTVKERGARCCAHAPNIRKRVIAPTCPIIREGIEAAGD